MRHIFYILCFLNSFALSSNGDSVIYKSKYRIDLNYGSGLLTFQNSNSSKESSINNPLPSLNVKSINAFELAFQYCLKSEQSKIKSRNFYLGLDYGLSFFDISSGMNDYSGTGHFPNSYHFENAVLNTQNIMNNLGLFFSFYRRESKFFIAHQLGVNYAFFSKQMINKSYTETVSSGYPATSPLYITSQNPEGWYWVENSSVYNRTNTYSFSNSVNPFYRFEIGAQFGRLSVHIGFDINYFGNKIRLNSDRDTQKTYELISSAILAKANAGLSINL